MIEELARFAEIGQHRRRWYNFAYNMANNYAIARGYPTRVVVSVLAITSPRVSVWQNWRMMRRYMENSSGPERFDGLMGSTIAALKHYEATGEIRGPKTAKFRDAIMLDPDALVLDVWMARAFKVTHAEVTHKKHAEWIFSMMRNLALDFGWTIAETQAAVWDGIRRTWSTKTPNANQLELAV